MIILDIIALLVILWIGSMIVTMGVQVVGGMVYIFPYLIAGYVFYKVYSLIEKRSRAWWLSVALGFLVACVAIFLINKIYITIGIRPVSIGFVFGRMRYFRMPRFINFF